MLLHHSIAYKTYCSVKRGGGQVYSPKEKTPFTDPLTPPARGVCKWVFFGTGKLRPFQVNIFPFQAKTRQGTSPVLLLYGIGPTTIRPCFASR